MAFKTLKSVMTVYPERKMYAWKNGAKVYFHFDLRPYEWERFIEDTDLEDTIAPQFIKLGTGQPNLKLLEKSPNLF